MDLKRIKLTVIAKIVAVATLVVLLLMYTPIWSYIEKGISPMLAAFVLAYMLDYIVRFFEHRLKCPRLLGIALAVLVFLGIFVVFAVVVVPSIVNAVVSLIDAVKSIKIDASVLDRFNFDPEFLETARTELVSSIMPTIQKLTNVTGSAVLMVIGFIQKFTSGVLSFLISLFIAIYILIEKRDLLARFKRLLIAYFSDEQVRRIVYTAKLSDRIFRNFILGKLLDSTVIGFLSFVLFSIFRFQYPMLMALIIGVTNMIPYFGPFIGAVPAAVITLIANPTHPIQVVYVLTLILIIQQLDGWIIGPFILGDSVGVSAFWIITAVTIGGATFGFLGMFLGVPVCVLIKTLVEENIAHRLREKGSPDYQLEHVRVKGKPKSKRVSSNNE